MSLHVRCLQNNSWRMVFLSLEKTENQVFRFRTKNSAYSKRRYQLQSIKKKKKKKKTKTFKKRNLAYSSWRRSSIRLCPCSYWKEDNPLRASFALFDQLIECSPVHIFFFKSPSTRYILVYSQQPYCGLCIDRNKQRGEPMVSCHHDTLLSFSGAYNILFSTTVALARSLQIQIEREEKKWSKTWTSCHLVWLF